MALGVGTLSNRLESLREQAALLRPYLVFALLALLYLYPFMRLGPQVTDEGTLITGAVRVAEGQVPSRDFFEGMGPGTFYWLALYFKIFGTTWFATRVSVMVTSLSIAMLLYILARRLNCASPLTPAVIFVSTSFGLLWPAISHHGDSTLFALLSFTGFVYWLDSRRRFLLVLVGVLAGLTTCVMQQKGVLLYLSYVVVIWLLCRREAMFRSFLGWLSAGYFAVGSCVLALFWRAGALQDLIYVNVIFPLTRYSDANSVPYGLGLFSFYWHRWTVPLNEALSPAIGYATGAVLIVPFLLVASLPVILAGFLLWGRNAALNRLTAPYWASGVALWVSEIHRKDIMHLVYGSPLLIVLCIYLLGRLPDKGKMRSIRMVAACAWVLAMFNLCVVSTAQTRIATRRGTVYNHQTDTVLEYLNAHVRPGEEIFAYPFRPMYYFLLDARNATRYSFFMPGWNTESQLKEVVDTLEQKKIRHVIWDDSYESRRTAWAFPRKVKTVQIVEPYLKEHYMTVYSSSGVRVMERKK